MGPAPIPDRVRGLAARLPARVRLGTSSWSFPGWRGIVYDRPASETLLAREGLAAYARHPLLRTVSLDRTYYAPWSPDVFAGYAAQVPVSFRFLVKAASQCTSPREATFLDASFAAEQVVGPAWKDCASAGPLVFQFPPLPESHLKRPEHFAERLHGFLDALPADLWSPWRCGTGGCWAGRTRRPWPRRGLALPPLHPRLPALAEQRTLTGAGLQGPLIVRWMLHPGRVYDEARAAYAPFDRLQEEDPAARESVADLAAAHLARGHEVYVTINNKAEGSAPSPSCGSRSGWWRGSPPSGPAGKAALRLLEDVRRAVPGGPGAALARVCSWIHAWGPSRLSGGPWTVRWRWPACGSSRGASPSACGASLRGRTRRPACSGRCRDACWKRHACVSFLWHGGSS